MNTNDPLARILSHPLLRELPERTLTSIRQLLVRRNVRAGTHVFSKGGQPSGWYGIVEGEVRIVTSAASGTEIVLTVLEAGDWFGEVAILAERPNSHDAVARVDCDLAFIPTTSFRQLLAREPDFHGRFVALLGQRVQLLIDVVEDFTMLPMAARLAKRVLAMTSPQPVGSVVRRGRISQEEYALLVGAQRQSVNRQLREWERAGWIRIGYGGIEVLDREALKRCIVAE